MSEYGTFAVGANHLYANANNYHSWASVVLVILLISYSALPSNWPARVNAAAVCARCALSAMPLLGETPAVIAWHRHLGAGVAFCARTRFRFPVIKM